MKRQDKDLLIKDLCARLPYETVIIIDGMYNTHLDSNVINAFLYGTIENVKPYLFPLPSMTEEQRKELLHEKGIIVDEGGYISPHLPYGDLDYMIYFDWLNEHHFDYRGLIDKSLAIDCTNLNIY